jgi:hypothetical protein
MTPPADRPAWHVIKTPAGTGFQATPSLGCTGARRGSGRHRRRGGRPGQRRDRLSEVAMQCIDLRTLGRYRVWNEIEGRWAWARDDAGDLIVPGRGGFIATWGDGTLAACTKGWHTTQKILDSVPGAYVAQDGDDGQNVVFPAEYHGPVARILRSERRQAGNKGSGNLLKSPPAYAKTGGRQALRTTSDDSQAT